MESTVQCTFARREMKFRIPAEEYPAFRRELEKFFTLDQYGLTKILNIYYDTEQYDLISQSLKKPKYKEKLRLRSYGVPSDDGIVFAEMKKKTGGIVYKRRSEMTYREADLFLNGKPPVYPQEDSQINRELAYFLEFHHPEPKLVLCYDREAFFGNADPELRLTIDRNIRYRTENLDLREGDDGALLSESGDYLLEVKIADAVPAPLARLLAEHRVYPVSFSKYGRIYEALYARPALARAAGAEQMERRYVKAADGFYAEGGKRYVYQHS